jgi:cyclomaltodextrinase / maltogenic alpha-amylase / neopullulanase
VYYGTEVGLSGGEEPGCREAFPWGDPQAWPQDLRAFIASLAALRREQPALRSAELAVEVLQGPEGDQGLRLVRGAPGGEQVEVVLNRSRRVGLEVAGLEGRCLLWACPADRGVASFKLPSRHACVVR